MPKNIERAKILINIVHSVFKENENNLQYNRSEKGVVQIVNDDGTVNLTVNNESYENIRVRTGLTVLVGNVVWVLYPKNSTKDMFVDESGGGVILAYQIDGGVPNSIYGGTTPIDGGGI